MKMRGGFFTKFATLAHGAAAGGGNGGIDAECFQG
jgi:hypothetical protein